MKKFYCLLSITLLSLCPCNAQSCFFSSIGKEKNDIPVIANADTTEPTDTAKDIPPLYQNQSPISNFLSTLTFSELQYVYERYKSNHCNSKSINNRDSKRYLHLYNGESHPLTIANVLTVMDEVGISNQLMVLAQSLLETGFYKSNVCHSYNNLFGLYDSRHKDYYRFERWEDSVVGYKKFIQYRYKGGNYLAFLKRIGYAEDPKYITKVADISRKLKNQATIID